ncbi:MAG TPA: peptidyl-prolyl cis-trans isomerase [Bacillota bacterium]|nr:peptidyl-prolyl cis-trans isomerase [Bacillota bacterium]
MTLKFLQTRWVILVVGLVIGCVLSAVVFNLSKDKTIAVVDGRPIKQSELYRVLKNQAGANALQRMIDNYIVEETAKSNGVSVTSQEVEAELNNKINMEYHSEEAFLESLKTLNMTLADAKEELRLAMLFDRIATKDIQVTEAEIQAYYQKNLAQFQQPEIRRVREIVLSRRSDADETRKELLGGADFAELVRKKSTGLNIDQGGDRGFVVKGALNPVAPQVEKVVFELQQDELSPVIQCSDGYHIIKVEAIVPPYRTEYNEQNKPAIALKTKLEKCRPFQEILLQMRQDSKIKILDDFGTGN